MLMLELGEPCALYCEEEDFDEDFSLNNNGPIYESANDDSSAIKDSPLLSPHLREDDLYDDNSELVSLISKESENRLICDNLMSDGSLLESRREAVGWILWVNAHCGFSVFTASLAVNYLDRLLLCIRLRDNRPWRTQLTAVACLSLAAKIHESHVPLLLDLQVESKYVFEAKTIQRMELLVLSTLGWRMYPVTPVSFFHHVSKRLRLKSIKRWEFLLRCENLLLSVIADAKLGSYLPSVVSSAIMLCVVNEAHPPCDALKYHDQLMNVVDKTNEGKVNECYKLVQEISGRRRSCGLDYKPFMAHKRMILPVPSSPVGVGDASFCSASSSGTWAVEISPSCPPDNYDLKRRKIQY
ncbi:hypothetical protein SAY87_028783 [Trapa incisa]|uniref:Cyclin-like domain-containing protein n=1 Tax=Trapa incisa TaxID=236973 RepID=A0AAN7QP28_9MYRT|nr:hypothetical protein SAY87_028783 [Trapa incisa]